MKLKQLIAATSLAFASLSAAAIPLDQIVGNLDIKLGGLTTEYNTTAGTNETTWGIGNITSITSNSTGDVWNAGDSDGSYLYYMIYGIADLGTSTNSGNGFNIFNIGATGGPADGKIHLDIFRTNTKINPIHLRNANPNDRTAFDMYSPFAALGPAYLQFTFGNGIVTTDDPNTAFDERQSTLYQDVTGITLPASGKGAFFLDVVGGTAQSSWDTNGREFGHDASGNFTLRPNFGIDNGNCTQAQATGVGNPGGVPTCFAGLINDPILTNKIPEPGSLALLGLGFAGLAGLRRRRAAK